MLRIVNGTVVSLDICFSVPQICYEHLPDFGPDHKKTFSCRATVGERSYEPGTGTKKVIAKKNAALNALKVLFDMPVELGKWTVRDLCLEGGKGSQQSHRLEGSSVFTFNVS